MSRAQRRQAARDKRAATWRNLSKTYRQLADNQLLPVADRTALRKAAARLDRGDRPLVVLASIAGPLSRVDKLAKGETL